jgi:hypothetical protein
MKSVLHHWAYTVLLDVFPDSVVLSQNKGCFYLQIILLRVGYVLKLHCLKHLTVLFTKYMNVVA